MDLEGLPHYFGLQGTETGQTKSWVRGRQKEIFTEKESRGKSNLRKERMERKRTAQEMKIRNKGNSNIDIK